MQVEDGTRELGAKALQRRLHMLFRVVSGVGWFGLVVHLILRATGGLHVAHRTLMLGVFVGAALLSLAFVYVTRRSVLRSLRGLLVLDAIAVLTTCSIFTASLIIWSERVHEVYFISFIAGMCVVGRALFVPTSVRHTATLVGIAATMEYVAIIVAAVANPEHLGMTTLEFLVNMAVFAYWPAVFSVAGAWQVDRLRGEVDAARTLGSYTLGDKIGEGGMGTVFFARHAMLRRPSAIKLLPPERMSEQAVQRFEREVQLTSELTDPHVVSVFDYGRSSDGTFYYVMEYLDGIDLEALVRDHGAQPPGRVIDILRQVCEALSEAHSRGLIHRDIKPANIVLCERGSTRDFVKVLDFGLVKQLGGNPVDQSSADHLAGTPLYMSPEALRDPSSIGSAADLYAVGAVAYFLLTGQRLFDVKTFPEICAAHLAETPVPPSERTGRTFPPALEALVLRCLEKEPAARPESAQKLAALLDELAPDDSWSDAARTKWWSTFRGRGAAKTAARAEVDVHAQTMAVDLGGRAV